MKLVILNKNTLILIVIILILIIALPFIILYLNASQETFKQDIFYQGNKDEKIIAFACNIDWGNEYIPEMLKVFEDNKINITFFPTGRWAENNTQIVKEIYSKGHEIGNHGFNHIDYDKLSYEKNKEEILKAHHILKDIVEENPKYFAPPSGAYNDNTVNAAKDLGYKTILWSIDTIDWRNDATKDLIVSRIKKNLHNSAIVLMHPTEQTVRALPEIINYLFQKGYKIGTISDVIK